jgi:MYXO-CTERM domain-containing protein
MQEDAAFCSRGLGCRRSKVLRNYQIGIATPSLLCGHLIASYVMTPTGWSVIMKKLSLALVLAVALVALPKLPVYAQTTPYPCPTAVGCSVSVPEPSTFTQLAVGLLAVGGLALFYRRKRSAPN